MTKQTAIEWLANEMPVINWSDPYWKVMLEKAKAMEKEQIEEAYDAGLFDGTMDDVKDRIHSHYYNETYGGDK